MPVSHVAVCRSRRPSGFGTSEFIDPHDRSIHRITGHRIDAGEQRITRRLDGTPGHPEQITGGAVGFVAGDQKLIFCVKRDAVLNCRASQDPLDYVEFIVELNGNTRCSYSSTKKPYFTKWVFR
jgi:hypothetical protein